LAPTVGSAATGFCYPGGILQAFIDKISKFFIDKIRKLFIDKISKFFIDKIRKLFIEKINKFCDCRQQQRLDRILSDHHQRRCLHHRHNQILPRLLPKQQEDQDEKSNLRRIKTLSHATDKLQAKTCVIDLIGAIFNESIGSYEVYAMPAAYYPALVRDRG
jgi:hypothetical protein